MTPLTPTFDADEFQTSAPETLVTMLLAFRDGSPFEDDVLTG